MTEETNEISKLANMRFQRANHGAVKFDEEIYVFGGVGRGRRFSSDEKYNISTNTWTTISAPQNFGRLEDQFIS